MPTPVERTTAETRVVLLPLTKRDADALSRVLAAEGIACEPCGDIHAAAALASAGAGAVVVAEEALAGGADGLAAHVRDQPVWSDLPVVVLSRPGAESPAMARTLGALGNVTVVERPVRISTLVSVVRAALRARERQYQVRDQFAAQRRDQALIRQGEERLRAAFDQTAVGMVLSDLDGRIVRANEGFYRIVGRPAEELLGRDSRGYTHPDDVARNTDMVGLSRAAGPTGADYEKRYVRPDGRVVHARVNLSPVRDAAGAVAGLIAVVEDVSARREAEAALAEHRRRAEAALLAGEVGTYYWDIVADRVYGDRNFVPLYDVALDADGSAPLGAFVDAIHPDDRGRVGDLIRRTIATDVPFEAEYRVVGTGGERWVVARGRVERDAAGDAVGWPGVVVDITQRKRSEEALRAAEARLRQMADAMPQMVWVARPDGFHEYYNHQWYEFTGVPEGSTDGEGWNGMFHPDDRGRAWAAWRRSLTTGDPYEVEYRLWHHSGEYRWTLGRALAVRDAGGAIERWFGTCTDIDGLKRLTDERAALLANERAARAEVERASRMKDEFLATLSHELRTPLNAVVGWSQILRRGTQTEADLREGLATIERNALAQARIIEDLLDMSRIINGKVRLDVQRIDLGAVVRAAVETVQPAADGKGVRLHAVLDPTAGPVGGDPNRLQQVFWNLLSNAVKFTPRGGRVQVLLERVNSHLEVSVIDSGEGISPDFLPHVFDRFRQQDASTTRRHGGLGLGLAIVRQLVELHGGTVRVDSGGPGLGSTFVVAVPMTVVHAEAEASVGRRHPGAGPATAFDETCATLDGVRVLVVDDEPDARAVVQRLLEHCDAIVTTAGSAAEALERLQAERPQVLVSDVGMPGEDGYSLIRRVRELAPACGGRTPAVALTAYARAEDRISALTAGFDMHLVKPVQPAELVAVVASLALRHGV